MSDVDNGAQGGSEGAQSGTSTDANATGTGGTGTGAQSGTGEGQGNAGDNVSRADFETLKRQLQAADQKRAEAEAKVKAAEDAKLTADQKLQRDFEEQKALNAKLQDDLKQARIQNAFVTDNTYSWHDPKAALRLADLTGVEISEDGTTVKGLKDALKAVADANPWMLKPKEGNTSEGEGGSGSGSGSASTGGATGVTGQGAGNGRAGNTKADLEKRFPQMRGRVS